MAPVKVNLDKTIVKQAIQKLLDSRNRALKIEENPMIREIMEKEAQELNTAITSITEIK